MKTTERFDNAVSKLYTAYHNNTLNAFDCKMCAVGNILNNDMWWGLGTHIGKRNFDNEYLKISGYSSEELNIVELMFMRGINNDEDNPKFRHLVDSPCKETQFKGLCAVVEYLCELDNIPNVMDYTKLFESENNEPKYQLQN